MPDQSFQGNSKSNNITEALNDAIQKAKDTLKTDMVTWKLEEVSGTDGGMVQVHELNVSISAHAGMK